MYKTIFRIVAVMFFAFSMTSFAQDVHFTEDFGNLPSSYTTGDLVLPSGAWSVVSVYGESAGNSRGGVGKAARINDDTEGASLTTPAVNGVTTISFYYRELNSGGGTFQVQKSVDGGPFLTFHDLTYAGNDFTLYEYDINDESDNIRIRILNDNQAGHLIIDDLTLGSYGGSVEDRTILFTDFEDGSLDPWTTYNVASNRNWTNRTFGGNSYAEANGFGGDTFSDDWLISPELDLSSYGFVQFSFDNAKNFSGPDLMLKISTDYDGVGNPNNFSWDELEFALSPGGYVFVGNTIELLDYLESGVYLAFHYVSDASGAARWQVDNTEISWGDAPPPPVPAAFDLSMGDYSLTEWSSSNAAGTYPESMIFRNTNSSDPSIEAGSSSDYTSGYGSTSGSRVNGLGSRGFSFVNTGSGLLGDAILALDTRDRVSINVEWTGDLESLFCETDRDYRIRLQYRVGEDGDWANVLNEDGSVVEWANTDYLDRGDWSYPYTPSMGEFTETLSAQLPVDAENKRYVQVRWRYFMNENIGFGGCRPELRVDDISVTSESAIGNPTKLIVTQVNPLSPMVNVPFAVTVRATDDFDVPKYVNENTNVVLTLIEGTGNITGTLNGTIKKGTNTVVFENLSYNTAERIRVQADDPSPFGLVNGKLRFDVTSNPTLQLMVSDRGYAGITHAPAHIRVLDANGEINTNYTDYEATLSVTGTANSTYNVTVSRGHALIDDIVFNTPGTYNLTVTAPHLSASNSVTVSVNNAPTLVEHLIPMNAKGEGTFLPDGNGRMPAWALVEFTNLHPNTTYRFFTSGGSDFDIANDRFGAGTNIHYDVDTDTYFYNSDRDMAVEGQHSSFRTSQGETSKKVWVNLVPTSNSTFAHGNSFTWIVNLGDEQGNFIQRFETVAKTITKRFGSNVDELSGLYDDVARLTPRNLVAIWEGNDVSERPISIAMVQDEGALLLNPGFPHLAPAFYEDIENTNGAFATYTTNLSEGINVIRELDVDGMLVNEWTDEDGNWANIDTRFVTWGMNPPTGPGGFHLPRVDVITPMAAEEICTDDTYQITWESEGMQEIDIQISVGGGAYNTLFTGVNARLQYFDWDVPRELYSGQDLQIRLIGHNEFTYIMSESAPFRIYNSANIISFTNSRAYCEGDEVTIGVTASGDNLTFQWYKDGVAIEGATEPIYGIDNVQYSNSGVYTAEVMGHPNTCGSKMTDGIGVYIARDTDLTIDDLPEDARILPNRTAKFQVKPHVNVTYPNYTVSYQWYEVIDGGNDVALQDGAYNGRVAGARSSLMTIQDVTDAQFGKRFYVVVNGLCDATKTSNIVSLEKVDISIVAGIDDVEACELTDVQFTVTAESSSGEIDFTWFKNGVVVSDNDRISGAKTNTLTIANVMISDEGTYTVQARLDGIAGAIDTDEATLMVTQLPVITSITDSPVSINDNDDLSLEVIAEGDDLTYQWYKDGEMIDGETNSVYSVIRVASASDYAGEYTCEVINSCEVVVSPAITVVADGGTPLSVTDATSKGYALSQAMPNPAYDNVTINYFLNTNENVTIKLVDARGNFIANLVNEYKNFGQHQLTFNVSEFNFASGTYFYILETPNVRLMQPIVIVK